jgi:hypothetical protein
MNSENTEIVLSNPYMPQSWEINKAGGHPQTPGRKYPATIFHENAEIALINSLYAPVLGD